MARHGRQSEGKQYWSSREWARRERELRLLAPRADAAIDASGVSGLALYGPPAIGEPLIADDLASMIFHVEDRGFGVETRDDGLMRAILDRLPTQIAGLEIRLEEAKEREAKSKLKLPTVAGRIRHVPPVIGFIADVGGIAVAIAFAGHFVGFW